MPFGWSDFIDLAEWLNTNAATPRPPADPDAAYRACASRAYYGAFQLSLALLVKKGEYAPKHIGEDHGAVVRVFKSHNAVPRRLIGEKLARLLDRRRKADYELSVTNFANLAEASVRDAKEVRLSLRSQ